MLGMKILLGGQHFTKLKGGEKHKRITDGAGKAPCSSWQGLGIDTSLVSMTTIKNRGNNHSQQDSGQLSTSQLSTSQGPCHITL